MKMKFLDRPIESYRMYREGAAARPDPLAGRGLQVSQNLLTADGSIRTRVTRRDGVPIPPVGIESPILAVRTHVEVLPPYRERAWKPDDRIPTENDFRLYAAFGLVGDVATIIGGALAAPDTLGASLPVIWLGLDGLRADLLQLESGEPQETYTGQVWKGAGTYAGLSPEWSETAGSWGEFGTNVAAGGNLGRSSQRVLLRQAEAQLPRGLLTVEQRGLLLTQSPSGRFSIEFGPATRRAAAREFPGLSALVEAAQSVGAPAKAEFPGPLNLPLADGAVDLPTGIHGVDVYAPEQVGSRSIRNESTRLGTRYGLNYFKTSRLRKEMARTQSGRMVLEAADRGEIDLIFDRGVPHGELAPPPDLYGEVLFTMPGDRPAASVYLWNNQNGRVYNLLGVRASGYQAAAGTGTHEGLHLLGIAGSRRAEALVRLAELEQLGLPIDARAMRQVLTDMGGKRGLYQDLPWRSGRSSLIFRGLEY